MPWGQGVHGMRTKNKQVRLGLRARTVSPLWNEASLGRRCTAKNVSGSARMNRLSYYMMRMLPVISLALAAIAHGENRSEAPEQERFELVETTIADIQQAYRSELLTPEQLVKMYQARIAAFDRAGPHLNGYMFVNPNADRKSTRLN